jgi:uncharacterized protein (TIGR02145 family)
MKKTIFAFLLISVLFSCEKETSTPIINPNDVTISGFDCAGVAINGKLQKDQVASNVSVTITYSGGNGKTYLTKSHTSTGVTGLSATLLAGTLANGEGVLTYSISGTPTTAGIATFAIDFGGKSCTFTIAIENLVQNPTSGHGSNITDGEGNSYKTFYIGTQQWMGENLKASKYNDGTIIPEIINAMEWSSGLTTGAWTYYNNDTYYNAKYGKLYNWYAISPTTNGNKNVCPIGWHVPSDAEWTILTDYLGGESVAGGKLKEAGTTNWSSPNTNASNTSMFSALPGGCPIPGFGAFNGIGQMGYWWSSSEGNSSTVYIRLMVYDNGNVTRGISTKNSGFSVRCLKD